MDSGPVQPAAGGESDLPPAGTRSWPTPVTLFATGLGNCVSEIPQVGMDSRGDAFAAWATSHAVYVAEHAAAATRPADPADQLSAR